VLEAYVSQWLHLLARWFHVVIGAAWIGTSFYFVWLNNSVRPPETAEDDGENVKGVVWSVHGGAFYKTTKYDGAPATLPKTLHWFKWESYLTWISGVVLLGTIYWSQARAMMIDPQVADLNPWVAVAIGVGSVVGGWLVYDIGCRLLHKWPKLLAGLGIVGITTLAWGLSELLSARAAYIHVGAVLGTCMAANVFFIIIPGQRVIVDAMLKGETPDLSKGAAGALRSLHNNYITLPVLFIMVSNHFPFTFGSEAPWAVLAAVSAIGGALRHWFNLHGRGQVNNWLIPGAVVATLALAFVLRPDTPEPVAEGEVEAPSFGQVYTVIATRCQPCHSAKPTMLYTEPPQGLLLETPAQLSARANEIHQRTVVTQTMPLGNMTEMTDEEREILDAWFKAGAPVPGDHAH
jgi:uncharacterized membrane protein